MTKQNRLLDAALLYAQKLNWKIIPITPGGKEPVLDEWPTKATSDPDTIRRWWAENPDYNIGVLLGTASGVDVIDIDAHHGGRQSMADLEEEYGHLPDVPMVLTPHQGEHLYCLHPDKPLKNDSKGKIGPGIDFKTTGGQCVLPPSVLIEDGKRKEYTWEASSLPPIGVEGSIPFQPIPQWIIAKLSMNGKQDAPFSLPEVIAEGQRNATMAAAAGAMRRHGFSAEAIYKALLEVNKQCVKPLPDQEIRQIAGSIAKYTPADPILTGNESEEIAAAVLPPSFTAPQIVSWNLPDLKWLVPDLIPEGLTILAGKPKFGKSYFCLNVALACASGGMALNKFKIDKPLVTWYICLEDSERRIKSRIQQLLRRESPPPLFNASLSWPRLDQGGTSSLKKLVHEKHPELIIIDTLAKIRRPATGRDNIYAADYETMDCLHKIAQKHRIGIVVIHHLSKVKADDVMDTISGSTGLTAAVDTCMAMTFGQQKGEAVLDIVGRDVERQKAMLKFDTEDGIWTYLGDANEAVYNQLRQRILHHLRVEVKGSETPRNIADELDIPFNTVKKYLLMLFREDFVGREGGKYFATHKTVN